MYIMEDWIDNRSMDAQVLSRWVVLFLWKDNLSSVGQDYWCLFIPFYCMKALCLFGPSLGPHFDS